MDGLKECRSSHFTSTEESECIQGGVDVEEETKAEGTEMVLMWRHELIVGPSMTETSGE